MQRMQNLSDAELVDLYKQSKDQQYLTTLFTRHSDVVYRTALRIMRNASDAEDIMQTGYCKMIRDLHLYNGSGTVLGWMIQVIIHTCYQQKNSEKSRLNRERKMMSERRTTSEPQNNDLSETVENHLNKLPEIYKVPITLQIMEGLSIKEVSQALEIPEKTIRSQIARGLEKLRASLQTVGITASVISLGEILKEIQQPLAPETIKSSQFFQSIFQSKTTTSAKLVASSVAKGFVSQKLISLSLIFLFSIGGLYLWSSFSKKTPSALPANLQKWDFENIKDLSLYKNIGLLSGSVWIEESRGVNNSNALMSSEKTLIEFDISQYKLPIKVSYVTDTYRLSNSTAPVHALFKGNYLEEKITHIFGFRERITIPISMDDPNTKLGYFGKWFSHVFYVNENSIDFYVEGKRSHISYGASRDNKKLYLYTYRSIIDNLVIESIEKEASPKEFTFSGVKYKHFKEDDIDKYYLDKDSLGMTSNSTANPYFIQRSPENLANEYGSNNQAVYPTLSTFNKIVWERERNKIAYQWNFDDETDLKGYQKIGLLNGCISIVDSLGVNKSNGLVVEAESTIEFDISKFQLPIRVSYKVDLLTTMAGLGQLVLKNNYNAQKPLIHLSSLREKIQLTETIDNLNSQLGFIGKWYTHDCYVTDQYVDLWVDGQPSHYIKGASVDNQKIYLYIKGQVIIDDLRIESIDQKDLPNHNIHDELISQIKFQKDTNRYLLDKEKLGIDKNSETQPIISLLDPVQLEEKLNIWTKVILPKLGKTNKVEWVKNRQILNKNWSFDKNNLNGLNIVFGKAEIMPSQGINQTSCLVVEPETLLEIDISGFELPLKFEHNFDCKLPPGVEGKGILLLKSNYEVQKNIFSFNKCCHGIQIDISESAKSKRNENKKTGYFGEWYKRTVYISEECVDIWINGKRSGIVFGKSYDNKKLFLYVKDQTLFDNFELKSVSKEEIPDYSVFSNLVSKIPYKKTYFNFNLDTEKDKLGVENNKNPILEIYDKFTLEYSLGLRKNLNQNSAK